MMNITVNLVKRSMKGSMSYKLFSTSNNNILVIAELVNNSISPGTLSTINAANKIGGDITLFIAGDNVKDAVSSAVNIQYVKKVISVNNQYLAKKVAETFTKVLSNVVTSYSHVLSPSSNFGKNFLPRLASQFDSSPLSDVTSVIDNETFERPMYAGNAIATVKMLDKIKFLLIRQTSFEKVELTGSSAETEELTVSDQDFNSNFSVWKSESQVKSERPDLSTSRVVISGGRGMKNGENFAMLETLADKLKGAVGASRAAVDAGFISNEAQVGQTGKCVAPDLYIAVGISGAIQHLSGMKDSKTIVAINKDKDAPIFQVADYGIVDDLFKVIPEMSSKL